MEFVNGSVEFTKAERNKIWHYMVATHPPFFLCFAISLRNTLNSIGSYELDDGYVLIPYNDGDGCHTLKLQLIKEYLDLLVCFDSKEIDNASVA